MNEEVETTPTQEVSEKPLSAIDKANEVLEKMEKVRDDTKQWVKRAEDLKSEEMLGGSSNAGSTPAQKPKPLSDQEYAEAMEKGEVDPFKADGIK